MNQISSASSPIRSAQGWECYCFRLRRWALLLAMALPARAGDDRAIKTRVSPVYPEIAKRMKIAGVVRIEATVDPQGKVKEVKTVSGNHMLSVAAEDAVRMEVCAGARGLNSERRRELCCPSVGPFSGPFGGQCTRTSRPSSGLPRLLLPPPCASSKTRAIRCFISHLQGDPGVLCRHALSGICRGLKQGCIPH